MSGRVLASLVVVLCSGLSLAQERVPLIINGTVTDDFPAVGIVGQLNRGGFCTGTLISPNHVLTAAHCAEAILDAGDGDTGTFEIGNRTYRTASVEIISSYNSRQFTDDVAILVLDEPVAGVEPALLSDIPPEVGEVVTVVGFGGAGTAQTGSDGTFGVKRVGNATVDAITATEFSWSFDDPTESNAAPGDSGGPVFIDTGEALLLAGLVSSGTTAGAGLGDINFNMRVDAYEEFITDTINSTQIAIDDVVEDEQEEPAVEEEPSTDDEPSEELDDPTTEATQDEEADGAACRPRNPGCGSDSQGTPCKRPCSESCDEASEATTSGTSETEADAESEEPIQASDLAEGSSTETVEAAANPTGRRSSWRHRARRGQTRVRPRGGFFDASRNYRFESLAKASRTRANVRR